MPGERPPGKILLRVFATYSVPLFANIDIKGPEFLRDQTTLPKNGLIPPPALEAIIPRVGPRSGRGVRPLIGKILNAAGMPPQSPTHRHQMASSGASAACMACQTLGGLWTRSPDCFNANGLSFCIHLPRDRTT